MKPWLLLLIAACFEVAWVVGLRWFTFERPLLAALILAVSCLSVLFLERATHNIPLGVAYAVWTGLGVVGAFTFASTILKEKPTAMQVVFALVIVIGVIGLFGSTRKSNANTAGDAQRLAPGKRANT